MRGSKKFIIVDSIEVKIERGEQPNLPERRSTTTCTHKIRKPDWEKWG